MEPVLLITNVAAGGHDAEYLDAALEVLRGVTDVEVASTGNLGELDSVLHRRGSRRVVVAGGDGSLHAVIAALHRRHELPEAVLGLIPLGTGNDFARGLRIPLAPQEAAELVVKGQPTPVDLIVDCTGEIVVNSVHVGAGADAGQRAKRWKASMGRAGYVAGAAAEAAHPELLRLRVEVDGQVVTDFDRPVLGVALGNGPSVGGGTELTPQARPGDGQIDVMVAFAAGPVARAGFLTKLLTGRHPQRDDVAYLRGSTVSVSGQPFHISADGEISGPERNRTWRLEKSALTMLLPG
ncbi:MAG TPA: diacylglycerol kinase family protein [Nocardioidaceae bacterium]|nr:diacylglycerol kinase family protein [Nocardioidaceae bacterium]